ncbi:type 1 glutamine amidotransferase family protein [Lentzea jiangxiensis]|uniref:Putative intracellular protease/amidase n=1 Tax=Lentzea jiangxiensis TaxID=641025 RepID=A0A1H0U0D4_9PSEU|nr:type 1 glutamine amidotransferase family protein [Lentzea jiangxiensis]SDP59663.1 Putative intracellular protease/amidase [Lentzea jiangxiensis]
MTTRTVYLGLYDQLADWEYGHVAAQVSSQQFQQRPGRYEIRTVGLTTDPVRTIGGVRMLPDVALQDVSVDDAAMLVLPGGEGWETGDLAAFGKLARRFREAGKPVAAICGATAGLAAEGLLDDVAHTSNFLEGLGSYGGAALYRDERVVRDQGVITAGGASPLEFAREVLAELEVFSPATVQAWYELHRDDTAEAFGKLVASVQD